MMMRQKMTMKKTRNRILSAFTAIMVCFTAQAQEIVIDPSQIAASATNAAEQVDYLLDQLGELAHLGDQMSTVRNHIDRVFGEDGIGGKAISVMQDLGTLTRLTESYNSTIKSTERYIQYMKEMERFRLSDATMLTSYINSLTRQMQLAIETAKKILETLGFSKKEKKDELEKIIEQMEKEMQTLDKMVEIETEATMVAEGLSEFVNFIDTEMTAEKYVASKRAYGNIEDAGRGSLGVISMILAFFCIASALTGFVVAVRGGILGDPVANNAFYRVAVGLFIGLILLNIVGGIFGYKL